MENMINLENFADGALSEKVNRALGDVLKNIVDPNTDYKKKRKLTVDITFIPSEDRELAMIDIQTKTRLVEPKAVATRIIIGTDGKGGILAGEFKNQVQGQSVMKVNDKTGEITTTAEEKQVVESYVENSEYDLDGIRLVK